jgi:hypothetical protein
MPQLRRACAGAFPASSKIAISSELRAGGTVIRMLDSANKYYTEILKPEHDHVIRCA